jgi:hypothetical protein
MDPHSDRFPEDALPHDLYPDFPMVARVLLLRRTGTVYQIFN